MSVSSSQFQNKLKSLLHKVHLAEDTLLAALLLGMILLATSQIFLRNIFDSGIVWADPLLRVMVLWLGLLGALAATRENKHISIDLITRFLSESTQEIVKIVTNLFSSAIATVIAYHSVRFVLIEYDEQNIAFANVPAWMMELILPVAFGLISLRFLIHAILGFRQIMFGKR